MEKFLLEQLSYFEKATPKKPDSSTILIRLLTLFLLTCGCQNARAATPVSGIVAETTTWSTAGSPYYVTGPITVNPGITLTVDPGVVVKFAQNTYLDVSGTLNAAGTSGSRISFTDFRDDTIGGDTNGDGSASAPAAGSWWGINVLDGGSATMNYTTVRYTYGQYIGWWGNNGVFRNMGGVYKTGTGSLALQNSSVSDGLVNGVWIVDSTGTHTLSNNTISGNGGYGLRLVNTGNTVTLSGNSITSNISGPMWVTANSSGVAVNTDNTLSGTIRIEPGSIPSDATWSRSQVYQPLGAITVPAQVTLTIQPGATVKFSETSYLDISGTLNATGTSGNRISFTDFRDDTIGGDTNGDGSASAPATGSWWGINILDGGSATMNFCTVRYAYGQAVGWWGNTYFGRNFGGIYKTGAGSLTLQNSSVSDGLVNGVWIVNSTGTHILGNNTINGNGGYGVRLENTGSTVTLNGNTIGSNTSGPMYVTSNSSGVAVNTDNTLSGTIRIEGGSIPSDATWSSKQVYQPLGAITVPAQVNLTIQPGAMVKFSPTTYLDISGTLNATGTAVDRISFTDFRDDTIGGDTNSDGSASAPAAGSWWGINVLDGGSATLNYCTVRYAYGQFIGWWGNNGVFRNMGGVYKTGAGSLTLKNSLVSDNIGVGVWLAGTTATATIASNTLEKNHDGLLLDSSPGSNVFIRSNAIRDNTGNGIYCAGSSPAVTGNTLTGNGSTGITLQGTGTNPAIVRNIISANPSGIACVGGANPIIGGTPGLGNNLLANTALAVSNDTSSVTVNARYNWWGTPTGPSLNSANGVSLYVDYGNPLASAFDQGFGAGLVSLWKAEGNALDSVGSSHGVLSGTVLYSAGRQGQAYKMGPAYWIYSGTHQNCYPESAEYYGTWNTYFNPDPQNYKFAHVTPDGTNWRYHPENISGCRSDWYEWWEWQEPGINYIEYSALPAELFESGTPAFSLSFWISPANTGSNTYLLGKSTPDSGQGFDIRLDGGKIRVAGVNGWDFNITSDALITANNWHHIALSASSTEVQLYINGILRGNTPRDIISASSNPFRIGYTTSFGGIQYSGLMDEIAVYNRSLTASEIKQLSGVVPEPFTFISQTNMPVSSVIQSNPVTVAGSIYPTVITVSGGEYSLSLDSGASWSAWSSLPGTVSAGNQVKVRQTSSSSNATKTSATLTIGGISASFDVTTSSASYPSTGLSSWWRAEGNVFDAIGGNHGTLQGGATYAAGFTGQAFSFDGVSSDVNVPYSTSLDLLDSITLSAWINSSDNSGHNRAVAGKAGGYQLFLETGGVLVFGFYNGAQWTLLRSSTPVPQNKWVHLAATFNAASGAMQLFINGFPDTDLVTPQRMSANANPLMIGGFGINGAFFSGLIDEVVIFNRALSSSEIKSLYNVNANTLTIAFDGSGSGTVTVNPPGASGNAGWSMPFYGWDNVTMTAAPDLDAIFEGWLGGGCSGNAGCSPVVNSNMTVTATFTGVPPTTDFSGTPLTGVEPLPVTFSDFSGHGPLSWLWNFGDSDTSSVQHPSHLYEDPGTIDVSLSATNAHGFLTVTKPSYVTITACEHQPVSLLPVYYPSLQASYDLSVNGDTIRARAKSLTGSLLLGNLKTIYLSGGYDCPHSAVVGMTTLKGTLTVKSGGVILERIVIK